MKCPMGTLGCAQLGHFIKVKLYKLEGNKSLVKGYIGKSLIRIDGVTAPEAPCSSLLSLKIEEKFVVKFCILNSLMPLIMCTKSQIKRIILTLFSGVWDRNPIPGS